MKSNLILIVLLSICLSSCAKYHISTKSLLQQLANTRKENKITFIIAPPFFIPFTVTGNDLHHIEVMDKQNNRYLLPVTNKTSVRITKADGKTKNFYFNTLLIRDSTITGKMDHIFGTNITPISLNNVVKIELQKH